MKTTLKISLAACAIAVACLPLTGTVPKQSRDEPGGWCCLCMCHSADERKCSSVCIRMQHGTKIIEEPEMKVCTNSCLRKGVKQVFPENDWK